jgi:hypothetical protein
MDISISDRLSESNQCGKAPGPGILATPRKKVVRVVSCANLGHVKLSYTELPQLYGIRLPQVEVQLTVAPQEEGM